MLGLNIAGKGFISKFGYLKRLVQQIAHSRHVGHGPTWAYLQSNIIKATWPKKTCQSTMGRRLLGCFKCGCECYSRITCDIFYQEKKLHQFQASRICPTTWCPILCCWWSFSSLFTLFHIYDAYSRDFSFYFPMKTAIFYSEKTLANMPSARRGSASANFRARSAKLKSFASKRLLTSSWDQLSAGGLDMLSHPFERRQLEQHPQKHNKKR